MLHIDGALSRRAFLNAGLAAIPAGAFWPPIAIGGVDARDAIEIADRVTLPPDSIPCERIPLGEAGDYKPCIARLPDGELLLTAFHQHMKEGNKVLEQTLLYRSTDGGLTWSKPEALELL